MYVVASLELPAAAAVTETPSEGRAHTARKDLLLTTDLTSTSLTRGPLLTPRTRTHAHTHTVYAAQTHTITFVTIQEAGPTTPAFPLPHFTTTNIPLPPLFFPSLSELLLNSLPTIFHEVKDTPLPLNDREHHLPRGEEQFT